MTEGYVILVVLLWVGIGLLCAGLFVVRGGHRDPLWYLLGLLLGPLLIPIVWERGRSRPRRVDVRPRPPSFRPTGNGLRVLVGVDGSTESDRCLRALAHALVGSVSELVLVTVIAPDLVGEDEERERERARRMLDDRVARLPSHLPPPATEVLAGHPVDALLASAEERDVDLLVVGRRGHGLGERLLGSVAERLAHRSTRAVLLGSLPDRA